MRTFQHVHLSRFLYQVFLSRARARAICLQEDEDILTRWKHLALLVEFALSMQRTLQNINDQSFNHFVLRMGQIVDFYFQLLFLNSLREIFSSQYKFRTSLRQAQIKFLLKRY